MRPAPPKETVLGRVKRRRQELSPLAKEGSSQGAITVKGGSAGASTLYLVFCFASLKAVWYSLWAINIPNIPLSSQPAAAPELRMKFQAPFRMRCAKIGLKFYFLGGHQLGQQLNNSKKKYPRRVNIYDLESGEKSFTKMNSGKRSPVVFVANNKLYVVGSQLYPKEAAALKEQGMNYFEEFDPVSKQWKVLQDPPFPDTQNCLRTEWSRCTVAGDTVFLLGPYWIHLCFNLRERQWFFPSFKASHLPKGFDLHDRWKFLCSAEVIENYFYSIRGMDDGMVIKLGPYNGLQDLDVLHKKPVSLAHNVKAHNFDDDDDDDDDDDNDGGDDDSYSYVLRHLGDRFFCVIQTKCSYSHSEHPPQSCLNCGHPLGHSCGGRKFHPIPNERYFKISCYRDVSKPGSDDFQFQFLNEAEHIIPTGDFDSSGFITDCHIVGSEMMLCAGSETEEKNEMMVGAGTGEAKKEMMVDA